MIRLLLAMEIMTSVSTNPVLLTAATACGAGLRGQHGLATWVLSAAGRARQGEYHEFNAFAVDLLHNVQKIFLPRRIKLWPAADSRVVVSISMSAGLTAGQ